MTSKSTPHLSNGHATSDRELSIRVKPFLRWAGGKAKLVERLRQLVPADHPGGVYFEPFVGAGSLFFATTPKEAVLADSNPDLIACYQAVRSSPRRVHEHLQQHLLLTSEAHYYAIRSWYNDVQYVDDVERAAAFIYLNKTSFNGIWRVNSKGRYNVPYGRKNPPALPGLDSLLTASQALARAHIQRADFRSTCDAAKPHDFVYLDPPYPPLTRTSYFTHYTKERFAMQDHMEVASTARVLADKGCRVMVTNADTPEVRGLYSGFRFVELSVTRWISAYGKPYQAREVAILNYTPPGD